MATDPWASLPKPGNDDHKWSKAYKKFLANNDLQGYTDYLIQKGVYTPPAAPAPTPTPTNPPPGANPIPATPTVPGTPLAGGDQYSDLVNATNAAAASPTPVPASQQLVPFIDQYGRLAYNYGAAGIGAPVTTPPTTPPITPPVTPPVTPPITPPTTPPEGGNGQQGGGHDHDSGNNQGGGGSNTHNPGGFGGANTQQAAQNASGGGLGAPDVGGMFGGNGVRGNFFGGQQYDQDGNYIYNGNMGGSIQMPSWLDRTTQAASMLLPSPYGTAIGAARGLAKGYNLVGTNIDRTNLGIPETDFGQALGGFLGFNGYGALSKGLIANSEQAGLPNGMGIVRNVDNEGFSTPNPDGTLTGQYNNSFMGLGADETGMQYTAAKQMRAVARPSVQTDTDGYAKSFNGIGISPGNPSQGGLNASGATEYTGDEARMHGLMTGANVPAANPLAAAQQQAVQAVTKKINNNNNNGNGGSSVGGSDHAGQSQGNTSNASGQGNASGSGIGGVSGHDTTAVGSSGQLGHI